MCSYKLFLSYEYLIYKLTPLYSVQQHLGGQQSTIGWLSAGGGQVLDELAFVSASFCRFHYLVAGITFLLVRYRGSSIEKVKRHLRDENYFSDDVVV